MKVRYLKKQLYVGIVTLMIAFLSISSSTYAWFALNTSVKANGLQINASMEGINFEITNKFDSVSGQPDFIPGQTELTITYDIQSSLLPTHPQNLRPFTGDLNEIADWYHAYSTDYDNAQTSLNGYKWENVTYDLSRGYGYYWNQNSDGSSSTFALAVQYFVRLNPDTTGENMSLKDIKATNLRITDTSGNNYLSEAVYLLVSGPDGTYEISASEATSDETILGSISDESGVLISEAKPDDSYFSIVVFVFFDGQDEDCKSSNYNPNDISVSLEFSGTPA